MNILRNIRRWSVLYLSLICAHLWLLSPQASGAITATNIYTYASLNGTANSTIIAVGTVNLPGQTLLIQNGGLTATNALTVAVQFSLDGTNFSTISTYTPAATNAVVDSYTPSTSSRTVYLRAVLTTTNAVNVGVISATP